MWKGHGWSMLSGGALLLTDPVSSFVAATTNGNTPGLASIALSAAQPRDRRSFLKNILLSGAAIATAASSFPLEESTAYEKAYPVELGFANGDTSRNLQTVRQERIAVKKQSYDQSMDFVKNKNPLTFRGPKDVLTTATWGGALWLLSGSRSNPLVTPLANLIYDESQEEWLRDRNEGLFASVPALLYGVLAVVFFAIGIATDRIVLLLADGSATVSLQLASVALISGAAFELGRLSAGEKSPTREESDRTEALRREFDAFAQARLKRGGSCHRTDVVRAFRRYYGKYRQETLEGDYALTNIEIERLLKEWNRAVCAAEMSSAGFYNGLSVNEQADVFGER